MSRDKIVCPALQLSRAEQSIEKNREEWGRAEYSE